MSASRGDRASSRPRFLLIAASLAVVAGGAALYWYPAPAPSLAGAARPSRPAVRVSVAVATRQDVPVYASGLGTVQASFTIGIHSQVEGIM